jgi:hypothetical protein
VHEATHVSQRQHHAHQHLKQKKSRTEDFDNRYAGMYGTVGMSQAKIHKHMPWMIATH